MFTGIVAEHGQVLDLVPHRDVHGQGGPSDQEPAAMAVRIGAAEVAHDLRPGDSVAVNGCCVTVTEVEPGASFTADVVPETLSRTTLGRLQVSDTVNLERALRAGDRLDGHLVQGHVDGTGHVRELTTHADEVVLAVEFAPTWSRYLARKGSITVDGVSLTVVDVGEDPTPWFSVALIPTTLGLTTLGRLRPGDHVNLEVDVLAKYVERMLLAREWGPA